LEARATRRNKQYQDQINSATVKKELQERDERDKKRKNSPLIKTADSWELDTTYLSPNEILGKILLFIEKKQLN
jgi:cytidylate kinase